MPKYDYKITDGPTHTITTTKKVTGKPTEEWTRDSATRRYILTYNGDNPRLNDMVVINKGYNEDFSGQLIKSKIR